MKLSAPKRAALVEALRRHVRPPDRRGVLRAILRDGAPWSYRGGVLRVGEDDRMQGDAIWYYRGYFVQRDTGRNAAPYIEGSIGPRFRSLDYFKDSVDRRSGAMP